MNKNKRDNTKGSYGLSSNPSVGGVYSFPTAFTHQIDIDRDIDNPSNWREEISCLRNASPSDTIHMYINTDGGRLDTAFAIINAMKQCQGRIITELVGSCCSAGTAIFVHGDEFVINELQVNYMIHQASHGYSGIDSHVFDYAVHSRENLKKLYRDVYEGFLTEEEIELVTNGRELWLKPEEILDRCNNKIKLDNERAGIPDYNREYFEAMSKEEILDVLFPEDESDCSECDGEEFGEEEDLSVIYQRHYDDLYSKTKKDLEEDYNIKKKTKKLVVEGIMDALYEEEWREFVKLD